MARSMGVTLMWFTRGRKTQDLSANMAHQGVVNTPRGAPDSKLPTGLYEKVTFSACCSNLGLIFVILAIL